MYYIHHSEKVVLLILYIDDSFLTRDNIEWVSWLEKELTTKFDMTSLGLCSKYFGIQFSHYNYGLLFHQAYYPFSILDQFGMMDYNSFKTSMSNFQIV
jgi:hypothetical protein